MNVHDNVKPLYAYRTTNAIDLSAEPHTHDFFQFLYMIHGQCTVTVEDAALCVKQHHLLILKPSMRHGLTFPKPKTVRCDVFQMKCYLNDALLEKSFPMIIDCTPYMAEMEHITFLLIRAFADTPVNGSAAAENLLRYLYTILERCFHPDTKENVTHDPRFARVINYISAHPDEDISITTLAEMVSLNQSYFIRLFHKVMGISPVQYIIKKRMEYARNMLIFSSAKLSDIANAAGYHNYHHFSNQFVKLYGCRPKDYRGRSELAQ
ncbi:MAG: helix-turn-helix transcriptional regulator [Spirochaetes bacterium]|nr:helix-turn-helix transcriptional regulator [Spirochaetota bacterium]